MRTAHRTLAAAFSIGIAAMLVACSADSATAPRRRLTQTGDPSRAVVVNDTRTPVSGTVFNPCNGEPVPFQGYIHSTFRLEFDNGGGIHVGSHFNAQGITGVGAISGATYTGNQADNDQFNAKYGEEETFETHFSEIAHGPVPNFVLFEVAHVTVNANGTVTVFFDNFRSECQG
jgi:hypothetical protein